MKYVVCVPDGCADEPLDSLGGRTPLEVASMPTLRSLAGRGRVGRAAVIPNGLPPGSDVGNMSIFGYDPARFHTGRAPIEAAALGLKLGPDQVAYRCNLVTIDGHGTMVDFAGGHPTSDDAAPIIKALDDQLGGEVRFRAGVEYRHIMVAPAGWVDAECTPPHDLSDKAAVYPTGPAAAQLRRLMDASRDVVGGFGGKANQIWLWGQGFQPQMPSFLGSLRDREIDWIIAALKAHSANYKGGAPNGTPASAPAAPAAPGGTPPVQGERAGATQPAPHAPNQGQPK